MSIHLSDSQVKNGNGVNPQIERLAIEPESLRDLMKCWHDSARLLNTPLSQLKLFHNQMEIAHATADYARAGVIRSIMLGVLDQTLTRIPAAKQTSLPRGIIYAFYIDGVTAAALCQRVGLAEATLFRRMNYELNVACEVLAQIAADANTFGNVGEQPHRRFVSPNIPVEPNEFVHRTALVDAALNLLASPRNSTLALTGPAGAGKSLLAAALTRHKALEERFPDGVLWADLGQNGNPNRCLTEWLEVRTGGQVVVATSEASDLLRRLKASLADKKMLIVIDDVWNIEDAQALLVGGSGSRHILTMRSPAQAYALAGNNVISVEDLTPDEARNLLDLHLPSRLYGLHDLPSGLLTELNQLVTGDHTNRLPLAVQIAASRLRYFINTGQPWRISDLPTSDDSLDARITQSLSALSETDLAVLMSLSVFAAKPNSFTETQAFAVADGSGHTLGRLIDAGLVSPWRGRLTIHKSIWQHLRNLHASRQPNGVDAERSLIAFFCNQPSSTSRLNLLDLDNVKVALASSERLSTPSECVALLKSCYWLMEYGADHVAADQAIANLLSRDCSEGERVALEARRARLQWLTGKDEDAIKHLGHWAAEAVRLGDHEAAALCNQTLSNIHLSRQEVDLGLQLILEAQGHRITGVDEGTLLQAEAISIRHLLVKTRLDELKTIVVKSLTKASRLNIVPAQVTMGWVQDARGKRECSYVLSARPTHPTSNKSATLPLIVVVNRS